MKLGPLQSQTRDYAPALALMHMHFVCPFYVKKANEVSQKVQICSQFLLVHKFLVVCLWDTLAHSCMVLDIISVWNAQQGR